MIILQEHSTFTFSKCFHCIFLSYICRAKKYMIKCYILWHLFVDVVGKIPFEGKREQEGSLFSFILKKNPSKNKGSIQYLKQSINEYFIQIFKQEVSANKKWLNGIGKFIVHISLLKKLFWNSFPISWLVAWLSKLWSRTMPSELSACLNEKPEFKSSHPSIILIIANLLYQFSALLMSVFHSVSREKENSIISTFSLFSAGWKNSLLPKKHVNTQIHCRMHFTKS